MIIIIAAAVIIFVFALWLWMIAPRLRNRPSFEYFKGYCYAHRGLYEKDGSVPENSLEAFRRAAAHGYGMELDLQLTRDRQIVIHHDNNIKRMCGEDRLISDMTLAEIKTYRLLDTQQTIPTFGEVLAEVAGKTPLIIEYKGYGDYTALCEEAEKLLSNYGGRYMVESFHPLIVRWFKKNAPHHIRGQLTSPYTGKESFIPGRAAAWALRNMLSDFLTRPDFEAYELKGRENVSLKLAMKFFGMQRVAWTVRSAEKCSSLRSEGAIVIFEHFMP